MKPLINANKVSYQITPVLNSIYHLAGVVELKISGNLSKGTYSTELSMVSCSHLQPLKLNLLKRNTLTNFS